MKKSIKILAIILVCSASANAQLGSMLKAKAKDAVTSKINKSNNLDNLKGSLSKVAPSTNTSGMEGTWKVEGIIVNTEIEGLKSQLAAQEKQYNDE